MPQCLKHLCISGLHGTIVYRYQICYAFDISNYVFHSPEFVTESVIGFLFSSDYLTVIVHVFVDCTQLLEAETVRAIFLDNEPLCSEVSEHVIQHFVRATARHRHMQYLKVLQTIMKPKCSLIRKAQDMIMSEVSKCITFCIICW